MKTWLLLLIVLFLVVGCSEVVQEEIEPVEKEELPTEVLVDEKIVEDVETNEIAPEPVITEKQEVVEEPKEVVESLPEEPIQTQFYNDTKWMRMEMENVISNETFTIESLKGQKVIVELYSEQCYPCGEQKVKLQVFIEENNNSFKHISLNVDPISKKKDVIKLIDLHQYDWPFVLSSKELRVSIIKKFSSKAVRYDLAPLLLVCEDLSAHLLAGGIKGKHQLNIALKKCD